MSGFRAFVLLVVLPSLLAACATAPGRHPDTGDVAAGQAPRQVSLPGVELKPEFLYDLLVADLAVQRKQYVLAIRNYLGVARRTGDPRVAGMAARVAIYSRENALALEAARLWVSLDGEDPEARQAIIAAYIRNGRPEEAAPHIDALLDMEAGRERGLRLLASLLSRERDVRAALAVMKQVVDKRRDDPDVLLSYAHLVLRGGDVTQALAVTEQVLRLRPWWTDALLVKARLLQLLHRGDEARALLEQGVRRHEDDQQLRFAYARLLMEERRYEEALAQYELLAARSPDNMELRYTMGLLLMQLKRYDEAARTLESIRRRGGRFDDVNFYLGWIAENQGDADKAIDYYSAVSRGPNYLDAGIRMAVLKARRGELEQARQLLRRLRSEASAHRQRLYLVEGEILREAGRPEEALAVYTRALQDAPTDSGLRYARAIVAEQLDRLDLMEQDLRDILSREPDNVDALNALGYTLADRTDRYEEAYGYIKRALELKPDNNAILDSMGWVLYRMGNYEEAIKYLRQSLRLKMDDEVAAHLGEVLWVSGRHQEALQVWNDALEQFSGNKILLDVIRRFSH
ncbi:MAG TPA: tetratricopeptide repeat protein [Gammaproteobacteria bacterium]|nr:tetratricopeptide repeat protein [Gammaproteobacteria bacterium]